MDHTLLDITLKPTTSPNTNTRTWFCPVCRFTCTSPLSGPKSKPSLTDLRRHFVIRLLAIEKEARELGMAETATHLVKTLDCAGGEIEERIEERIK